MISAVLFERGIDGGVCVCVCVCVRMRVCMSVCACSCQCHREFGWSSWKVDPGDIIPRDINFDPGNQLP